MQCSQNLCCALLCCIASIPMFHQADSKAPEQRVQVCRAHISEGNCFTLKLIYQDTLHIWSGHPTHLECCFSPNGFVLVLYFIPDKHIFLLAFYQLLYQGQDTEHFWWVHFQGYYCVFQLKKKFLSVNCATWVLCYKYNLYCSQPYMTIIHRELILQNGLFEEQLKKKKKKAKACPQNFYESRTSVLAPIWFNHHIFTKNKNIFHLCEEKSILS